jgi:hypothetical protein
VGISIESRKAELADTTIENVKVERRVHLGQPSRRWQFSIAAMFGAMTVAGLCAGVVVWLTPGPSTYPVEGRVVLTDGTPIKKGVIEFVERDLGLASIGHIENGKFKLSTYRKNDGSPSGKYIVLVTEAVPPVHEMYGGVESTPLSVEVERKNEFVIKLDPAK